MTTYRATLEPSRLEGEVLLSGAKNSVLKLQAASLLTAEPVVIENAPAEILDFLIQNRLLESLGKRLSLEGNVLLVEEEDGLVTDLAWEGEATRTTLLMLGALLARQGRGAVPLPGGCRIGERKYDIHLQVMESLGATVVEDPDKGMLRAHCDGRLRGAELQLPLRSTGATENALIMGTLAEGRTRIWNPHVRPEILDLIAFLKGMGARIEVRGQESIIVDGVDSLSGIRHRVIPDNMEALTYLVATAIAGGEVEIKGFPFDALQVPLIHLSASGLNFYRSNDGKNLIVKAAEVYPFDVATGPFPGINSDMQPIFAALATAARGESHIADLRFLGRYRYAEEMGKLGAVTAVDGMNLIVRGGPELIGARVTATDLRGGAALLLCGLVASGTTTIDNFEQVLRGYDRITEKMSGLGARIRVEQGA